MIQENNFGLSGQSNFYGYDNENYDNLLGLGKKAKERREERREERKQRKEEKRADRQEKREAATEKRRLKNELKQTQIDEKKAQLSMLNQQVQTPPPGPLSPGNDNTAMIVAAVVGVIVITGIGYIMMTKKQTPVTAPVYAKAA